VPDDIHTRGIEALTPVMKSWGVHSKHGEWSDAEAQRDAARQAVKTLDEAGLMITRAVDDVECTCAMTEAAMRTCPVHGEDEWLDDEVLSVLKRLENQLDEAQRDMIRTVGREAGSRVAGLEQAHHILRGIRAEYIGERA
jgi:hypothetical protein